MRIKSILIHYSLFTIPFLASAAVTQRWVVETSRVQPVVFDAVRGETLSLEAAFQSYGKALAMPTNGWFILWQTNGMGSAWWSAGAEVEREVKARGEGEQSNGSSSAAVGSSSRPYQTTNWVVKAEFTPAMDPGSDTVIGFLGATGQNYRASFRLRFRHGPGERPNTIAAPVPILDLAHTTVINPPWPTAADFAATTTAMKAELKDYVDDQVEAAGGISPGTVGTIATNAITNVVTKAYVEGLGITASAGSVDESAIIAATNALATATAAKIAAATNGVVGGLRGVTAQSATNITDAIIASSNLCSVAAAKEMTNNVMTLAKNTFIVGEKKYEFGNEKTYVKLCDILTTSGWSYRTGWHPSLLQLHGTNEYPYGGSHAIGLAYHEGDGGTKYARYAIYVEDLGAMYYLDTHDGQSTVEHMLLDNNSYLDWYNVVNTPSTLSGYGIEDAYTKTEADIAFLGKNSIATAAWMTTGQGNDLTFVQMEGKEKLVLHNHDPGAETPYRYVAFEDNAAPKLTGRVYDFDHGSNFTMRIYAALTNVIQTLGGTVTNAPAFN